MGATTGIDLLIAAFKALSRDEQEKAFGALGELRLALLAGDDGLTAQMLRSLQRAAEHLGTAPNSSSYRQAWRELRDAGEPIENLTAVINHFG